MRHLEEVTIHMRAGTLQEATNRQQDLQIEFHLHLAVLASLLLEVTLKRRLLTAEETLPVLVI